MSNLDIYFVYFGMNKYISLCSPPVPLIWLSDYGNHIQCWGLHCHMQGKWLTFCTPSDLWHYMFFRGDCLAFRCNKYSINQVSALLGKGNERAE